MEKPRFLEDKYTLHNAPEVKQAAKRTKARMGEKVSDDPAEKVQNYLDRFKEITEREDPEKRERGMEALKKVLHDKFVIKPEEIPESYYNSIKRRHREEGHGDIEIPEEYRQDLSKDLVNDQKKSLDNWIDYLASDDAKYSDWLKYYAFRNILKMGRYDKKEKKFTERCRKTVATFPELNREALAITLGDIEKKENKDTKIAFTSRYDIKPEIKQKYNEFLENKNFPKLYALAIEEFKPIPEELLKNTKGEWRKYPKGSNYKQLVDSISQYGTGWCLRGEAIAKRYLVRDNNDLYVYYSHDEKNNPVVPRAVMVVNSNGNISEVRGVAEGENLDPYIGDIVEIKLNEFPDGKQYEKKSEDMKKLTEIEKKTKQKQKLTKDDLIFLYEINSQIEGFGYQNQMDPRIEEIKKERNIKEDAPIVLGCKPDEIAWREEYVKENTKAYIGKLFKGIFNENFDIYTEFSERNIRKMEAEIGGKSKEDLIRELKEDFEVSEGAGKMLKNPDFLASKVKEQIVLVILTVKDLGFPDGATTDEIYEKAKKIGLELCPAETGPHLILQYKDQPMGEYLRIGMKQITVASGHQNVFLVTRASSGAWLLSDWADPANRWDPSNEFAFRFRKLELKNFDS